jgi:digeranylgeranylglycerophospholipid reductase
LTPSWDVIVVGAGPAGLMAARGLAAAGRAVLVVEEHDRIGYPVHCTGLVGVEAFDELSLPRAPIRAVVAGAAFHGPDANPVAVETDRIRAAVVDRGEFDAALAADASACGAELALATRVEHVGVDGAAVSLTTPARGVLRARACVLACGASYRFNRALGLGVPSALVQSAQVELPFPAAPHVDVYLSRALAPGGFGWVVPFERDGMSWARMGLMCGDRVQDRFAALGALVWRERGVAGPVPRPRLKALPLGPVGRTYTDRIVAVGDAAGLVKPTTGGGIYYSLLSGSLAAQVLDDALERDALGAASLARYEALWRQRLGPDIRAGVAFRKLAARLDDRAVRALLALARVDGLIPLLKDHGDFNWHRRAVIALFRHAGFRRAVFSSLWS